MNTSCEQFQVQLLPYLYDLFEPAEQQEMKGHLDTCPACRAALERAQAQRKILALAAKAEFPNVHFQPPAVPAEVVRIPARRRNRPVLRWAIAAGIFALTGLGTAGTWWAIHNAERNDRSEAGPNIYALQTEREKHFVTRSAAVSPADTELKEVEQKTIQPAKEHQKQPAVAKEAIVVDPQLNVLVSGPVNILPGAPNMYQVLTTSLNGRPVATRLTAQVVDAKNTVVFQQRDVQTPGNYYLKLPADLPLKPDQKLSLEIVARREGEQKAQVRGELSLVAPVYVTHLYTDKPMYRPGETVRFRSLTLERFSLKPASEDFQLVYSITNPNGEEVFHSDGLPQLVHEGNNVPILGPDKKPLRGVGAGEYRIDLAGNGGEFTLMVREQNNRFPPQERKFIVNRYENPRLNKELDFTRKSYGPGDEVTAACKVARAEGGMPVARRPVMASIFIDGRPYTADGRPGNRPLSLRTDDRGTVSVRFKLPAQIDRGQGTLSVQFTDGASVETLVRPIPIALKKLQIEFFPEGGDLVAGLPNRVYFQARTMLGKPAEVTGRIVDQAGTVVVENVQTLNDDKEPGVNQGMGLFGFTPAPGNRYELKIDAPAGIEGKYELPASKDDGILLNIPGGVTTAKESIEAIVYSAQKDRQLLVGAYCRGRLMDHHTILAKNGEATKVALRPNSPAGGVYRVTVFEERDGDANRLLVPRAERLVYHAPGRQLLLNIKPDHTQYAPGERVKLSLKTSNEKEQETPVVLLASVVDKRVITLADEKTARSMPTHFLLTTEVRKPEDLEYADFLLGSHPKASPALDLLLGTQGWRRFAEQNPGEFQQKFGEDASRLLATIGRSGQNAVAVNQFPMMIAGVERLSNNARRLRMRGRGEAGAAQNVAPNFGLLNKGAGFAGGGVPVIQYYEKVKASPAEGGIGKGKDVDALTRKMEADERVRQFPARERVADRARGQLQPAFRTGVRGDKKSADKQPQPALQEPLQPDDKNAEKQKDPARPMAAQVRRFDAGNAGVPRRRAPIDFEQGQAAPVPPPLPHPFVVREYAHHFIAGGRPEERSDFVDTLYWNPAVVLADGKGEVSFDLCDSVTSYQVTVFGHTLDGRIGAATSTIESRLPFTIEPKLPIEVTAGDKIDIPVSIANNTSDPRQVNVRLVASNLKTDGNNDKQITINPDSRVCQLFRLLPSTAEGQATVRLEGRSDPFNDTVTRTFSIVPQGFPILGAKSDLLEKVAQHEIVLPETWIPGTLKCQVNVYPSTLAALQKGLDALLREPNGCFEQTSSSNYPNALILNYLRESDQANPAAQRRARDLLAAGYNKLVSFECMEPDKNRREGYEWFGGTAPAHEALTAYGLLEFRDMARVFDVDNNMVKRTRDYLMSRRDGKGGFLRNPRSLDQFGRAPDDVTNAYIVWAITESGKEDDVSKELASLAEQAKRSKDPYFLSLVAISLINRSKLDAGTAILKTVAGAQKDDGHLDAAKTSITGSGGRDLQIETTALAILGWLKANRPADFNVPVQKAIKWIGQQRGGYGGFGSTQSTILALKALIAYTNANKKTPEAGSLRLWVAEKLVDQLNFPAGASDALTLNVPAPEQNLMPGKNSVRIEITGMNHFPYTLSWSYQTLKPASAGEYPVRLGARLDREAAIEGETVHLSVTVENTQDKGQGMAVAIVGLPAGLTLPEDMKQLKDHARLRNDGKERGLISAWETRGREVILYWRDLAPKQKIEVPLDLVCRVPGEYSGPAGRAYLYYNSDLKHWAEPLRIKIEPKMD
jgi:anti-sigma factor RsiW